MTVTEFKDLVKDVGLETKDLKFDVMTGIFKKANAVNNDAVHQARVKGRKTGAGGRACPTARTGDLGVTNDARLCGIGNASAPRWFPNLAGGAAEPALPRAGVSSQTKQLQAVEAHRLREAQSGAHYRLGWGYMEEEPWEAPSPRRRATVKPRLDTRRNNASNTKPRRRYVDAALRMQRIWRGVLDRRRLKLDAEARARALRVLQARSRLFVRWKRAARERAARRIQERARAQLAGDLLRRQLAEQCRIDALANAALSVRRARLAQACSSLQLLDLTQNRLGDEGCACIAKALRSSRVEQLFLGRRRALLEFSFFAAPAAAADQKALLFKGG